MQKGQGMQGEVAFWKWGEVLAFVLLVLDADEVNEVLERHLGFIREQE